MTDPADSRLDEELERERKALEQSLNETLEATIRRAWLPNALAWLGVTLGGFALNLLVLAWVIGG